MMIVGSGIDIMAVPRLARFHERHGERGLRRIFTVGELDYCLGLARPAPSLAARFAAKEAFFKAVGTGIGQGGRWTDAEVVRAANGRPRLELHGVAARTAAGLAVRRIHLSLSHTLEFAVASVILEGRPGRE
jgi:holo-[acyl-carrier protein] synthase